MYQIKQIPPDKMDASQRLNEVAQLLPNGLVRLRESRCASPQKLSEYSDVELGFCQEKSVHTNDTLHNPKESV